METVKNFELSEEELDAVAGGLAVKILQYDEDWFDYICPRCGAFLDIPVDACSVGYTHKCPTCGLKYDDQTDRIL